MFIKAIKCDRCGKVLPESCPIEDDDTRGMMWWLKFRRWTILPNNKHHCHPCSDKRNPEIKREFEEARREFEEAKKIKKTIS